jgi:hypothetical protein
MDQSRAPLLEALADYHQAGRYGFTPPGHRHGLHRSPSPQPRGWHGPPRPRRPQPEDDPRSCPASKLSRAVDARDRDAHLESVLVGGRERREIVIVDYDPS